MSMFLPGLPAELLMPESSPELSPELLRPELSPRKPSTKSPSPLSMPL